MDNVQMIQQYTRVRAADNSGARSILCIRILKGSNARVGHVGDIFVGAVKSATPGAQVKKGDVVKAVIVRTKQPIKRQDGSTLRFDENAAVVLRTIWSREVRAFSDRSRANCARPTLRAA
jgi:large subunit ribosomal protein L14